MNTPEHSEFNRKKPVALIVILSLMTVTTLVLTTLGIINYSSEKIQRWTKLHRELEVDADEISIGLALPVWNIDRGQIDKVIESVMKNRDVYGVIVSAAGKNHIRVRDTLWGIKEGEKEFPSTGLLAEERNITFSNESIGHVNLFATTKFIEEELRGTLISTISTILVIDLILTLSLYLLIWRNVLKPLQEVEQYAVAVSSGSAHEVSISGARFPSELAGLKTSIEKMVTLLRARYMELHEEVSHRRESEERYRTLAETATDAIVTIDQESKILFVNAAIEKIFGYRVEELIGKQLTMLMPDYLRHVHETSLKRYVEFGKKHIAWDAVELSGLHKSGKELPLEISFGEFKKNGIHFFTGIIRDITERKRSEGALRTSEERFSKAFNLSPIRMGILRLKDQTIIDINDRFAQDIGISREEVLGRSLFDLGFINIEKDKKRIQQLLKEKKPVRDLELHPLTKSGEQRVVLTSTEFIEIGGDQCLLWASHDITERKQAEQALRESEAHYRALAENTPDIIAGFDHDCRYSFVNSSISKVSNLRPEEFVGKSLQEVGFTTEQAAFREKVIRTVFDTRIPSETEFQFEGQTGKTVYDWRVYPVLDSMGNVLSVFSISRDITERKKTEEELRQSEEKFAKAFHASPDSVTLSNLQTGKLLEVNDGFERLFGFTRAEAVGKSSLDLKVYTDPKDRERLIQILKQDGRVRDIELVGRTAKGEFRTCLFSAETINLGNESFLLTIVRDITERKQAEQELQESYKQLQTLAAHLETIREEERKHIAREIHDELGQVLTAVKMDLTILGKTADEGTLSEIRERLRKGIKGNLVLIDESIKSVRKISSELRPEVLDELGLTSAVEWQAQEFSSRTGIPCQFLPIVEEINLKPASSIALFRIVQEALTNISRHSGATQTSIHFERINNVLTITIHDNGKGFIQQKNPKTLGLIGMRERAILLGGEVTIQGQPGQGTTVTVRVPYDAISIVDSLTNEEL